MKFCMYRRGRGKRQVVSIGICSRLRTGAPPRLPFWRGVRDQFDGKRLPEVEGQM